LDETVMKNVVVAIEQVLKKMDVRSMAPEK
jgi:hypothetical protein